MEHLIQDGDLVIMYGGMDRISSVRMKKGQIYNTKHGNFQHNDIIGKPYGCKVVSKQGGWMAVLRPTPELWTAGALQHRTQIIYTTDISVITLQLELRPGSIAVESGTGSGSLSQAIARTVAPNGHLYTFEFHEQRAALAREMFRENKLDSVITVGCRDVCELGYTLEDAKADAVMLDLPCPWLAIPHAARVLKHYGTICNFSPCIEQVQRAAEALAANGFKDIRTVECLIRPFDTRPTGFKPLPVAMTTAPAALGKRGREDDKADAAEEKKGKKNEEKSEEESGDDSDEKEDKEAPQEEEHIVEEAVIRTERAAKPQVTIRGHTSYLTFARRVREAAPAAAAT